MRLLIIDSNALMHRSFHALPPLQNKKGEQAGAIYGFLLTLFKAIKDLNPDFIAATFDLPAPTFRHKKFKEYKAKRKKAPEEFYQQIPVMKKVLAAFSIPIFEKSGFEADDLIATISKKAPKEKGYSEIKVYILTGDFDTLQLVNKNTEIYTLGKGIRETVIYNREKIVERFGLEPEQMVDFKALAGDPSDNIPGVPGIGAKTATNLLGEFITLENLYKKIEKGEGQKIKPRIKNLLFKNKEQAFFSQDLVKTREDAPIDFNVKECKFGDFNKEKVEKILTELEFFSLLKRVPFLLIKNEGEKPNKSSAIFGNEHKKNKTLF